MAAAVEEAERMTYLIITEIGGYEEIYLDKVYVFTSTEQRDAMFEQLSTDISITRVSKCDVKGDAAYVQNEDANDSCPMIIEKKRTLESKEI